MATSTHAAVRWRQRRVAAGLVDVFALASPFVTAVVAVVIASRLMPAPTDPAEEVLWWISIASISGAVLFVTQRQARRLLPLSSLLRLCMAFPDQAPSRLNMAMRAGTVRDLERRLSHLRDHGLHEEPAQAAETILTLASALNAHDRRTRGHSERVRAYTDLLAEEMGLDQDERDRLRWSALLHDIGKLEVGRGILNKAGPLDDAEWNVMHQHPEIGGRVTEPLHAWLGEWVHAVDQHHENFDGTGYPSHLAGDEIAVGARIVAVADAFEVMTAMRSYKRPMDAATARRELAACSGAQFDPAVVRAFLNISLGRLTWITGPLAWLTSLRFVRIVRPASPALRGLRNAVAVTASLGVAALMSAPSAGFKAEADSLPSGRIPFVPGPSSSSSRSTGIFGPMVRAAAVVSIPSSNPAAVAGELAATPALTAAGPAILVPTERPANANPLADPKAKPDRAEPDKAKPDKPKPDPSHRPDAVKPAKAPDAKDKSESGSKTDDGDADESGSSQSGSQGNSAYAHDHSHDVECGNHGQWVSSHGSGC